MGKELDDKPVTRAELEAIKLKREQELVTNINIIIRDSYVNTLLFGKEITIDCNSFIMSLPAFETIIKYFNDSGEWRAEADKEKPMLLKLKLL